VIGNVNAAGGHLRSSRQPETKHDVLTPCKSICRLHARGARLSATSAAGPSARPSRQLSAASPANSNHQPSLSSTETAQRIELVFGTDAFSRLRRVIRKFGYGGTSLSTSLRHVNPLKCYRLSSTGDPRQFITSSVQQKPPAAPSHLPPMTSSLPRDPSTDDRLPIHRILYTTTTRPTATSGHL